MKKITEQVINFDCDGTLTKKVCWTEKDCKNAEVNKKSRSKIRELYKNHFIVIYTARRDHLLPATLEWLRRNSIPFHAISNNKIPGWIVDDCCTNIRDLTGSK